MTSKLTLFDDIERSDERRKRLTQSSFLGELLDLPEDWPGERSRPTFD